MNLILPCAGAGLITIASIYLYGRHKRKSNKEGKTPVVFEPVEPFQDVEDRQFYQALKLGVSFENMRNLFGLGRKK